MQSSEIEVIDFQHAILTPFQRLNLLKLMNFIQKLRQNSFRIFVATISLILFKLFAIDFFILPTFQFEQTVHELVYGIYLDYEELFIEYFIVLGVYKSQAFREIGRSFVEIFVFEVVHACFSNCFQIVHEDRSRLLRLLPVLLREGLYPLLNLFYFRLILDLRQIEGLNLLQEMLHVCLFIVNDLAVRHNAHFLEIKSHSFPIVLGEVRSHSLNISTIIV